MKKVAIIPAWSGSKGLKDKNIIDVCGKPLIAYTIEAAKDSELFERIIVSTDSKKYGEICEQYGAEVMYRGENLSNDQATTFVVIRDVLQRISYDIDFFVLLQPTSPLRTTFHIQEAVRKFESKFIDFDFLVSVKEAEFENALVHPIGEDESLKYFDADFSNYRRQLHKEYSPNGAIFIGKPKAYLEHKHFYGIRSLAYIMSNFDSIDIDDKIDYELACLHMRKRLYREK